MATKSPTPEATTSAIARSCALVRRTSRKSLRHAELRKILVAAGVVRVLMRVDQEPDRPIGDLLDGGDDLVRERGELRVDPEHPVGPDQRADRSALSLEHEHVRGQFRRLDLDRAEVLLLLRAGGRCEHQKGRR